MAERRTKIALALAMMVSAVGGSLMFLRPSATQQPAVAVAAVAPSSGLALRHRIDDPAPVLGVSHLLGSIEPDAAATAQSVKQRVATAAKTATNRQTFEVGELPPPSSAWQSRADTAWSPLHDFTDRPLVHRVKEGDTLSTLARQYLGSADRYGELFAANRQVLADPNHLRVGIELVIPTSTSGASHADLYRPASTVQAGADEARAPAAMVPISPGSWRRSRQADPPTRTYRVRAEDTLVDIAKQFYGDGNKFQELFEANRDQLASPDQLREGLLLLIP